MKGFTNHKRNLIIATLILISLLITTTTQFADAVSWSTYENRLTTYLYFDGLPAITQTSDGKIWVLWQKELIEHDIIVFITSSDFGTSWSTEKTLVESPGQNVHPSIRQASNGTIWLFWHSDRTGNYEIFYRTSSDLGYSWSNDTQLTNNSYFDLGASVVCASNGWVWVFWCTNLSLIHI